MKELKYSKYRGQYMSQQKLAGSYIMVYASKPENYFPALVTPLNMCTFSSDLYVNYYEVTITVCGKKQRAVREDSIYLFNSISEYNTWYNNYKNNKNNKETNMKSEETQSKSSLVNDILDSMNEFSKYMNQFLYGDDTKSKQEKSFGETLIDKIKDELKKDEEETKDQLKYKSSTDGTVELRVQDLNSLQYASLSSVNGAYRINGEAVDKESFDNAMDVFIHGGKPSALINSIDNILSGYQEQERTAKLTARKTELQRKIAEMQAELDALK
jgi:hypothetical protein